MAKIEFLGPINIDTMDIHVGNMKELSVLLNKIPQMKDWIDNSAVAVNNTIISSLDISLNEDDIITILPPVCGG
jgi:molybdopterin synthase sulfur carrier subunit